MNAGFQPHPEQRGITLTEVMVVVAIIGILAGLAVPSFQDMLERNRLKQVAEALKSDMLYARAEAIKRSQNIVVSRSPGNAGAWCYGININSHCDCTTVGSCAIKTVSGSEFSAAVDMIAATISNDSTFDFRRGTVVADTFIFNSSHYSVAVTTIVSDNSVAGKVAAGQTASGQVILCTPVGSTGISSYPPC
ncbi:MAG: GspH/FimT family pseudopilin [Methylococcaceae bacterium]|nr:GspH/FimT family pseudopilin [Methylococcaceae bacterium]